MVLIKEIINNSRALEILSEAQGDVMKKWTEKAYLSDKDLFRDEVAKNALSFYQLLILYIKGTITSEDIDLLAKKISYERMLAEVNIGEFSYNTNMGRSVLHAHLLELDVDKEVIHYLLNKSNEFFDQFVYQTVTEYSNLFKRNLDQKRQFIEDSHKDRLTILGQMSASFVHEFRNPLTSIMGFVKLLQSEEKEIPYLDIIEHELEQLNYRISQFLLASKREQIELSEVFSLTELIEELLAFVYPSILNERIIVEKNIDLVQLYGVQGEIKQVLLNIFMNSIEALKEVKYARQISLTVKQEGSNALIYIQNNGPAIPEEKQAIIFEPFVTTKAFGTGIGLFVSKEIIEKHNGTIACASNDYRTIFKITLPTA